MQNKLKKIKKMDVEADNLLELVELNGLELVLKTCSPEEVFLEKRFVEILKTHHLPHVELFEIDELNPNQLLLEYLGPTPTLEQNMSQEHYRKWGQITRGMHEIKSRSSLKIMPDGKECDLSWNNFLQHQLTINVKRHRENKTLEERDIQKIISVATELLKLPHDFSLIHGDLHENNAMVKGEEVVLFDKGSYMLYGDRYYDLATVAIDLSGEGDSNLLKAFIEGYGEDFLATAQLRMNLNMILRCFERYPNRFESISGPLLQSLLSQRLLSKT